ncbi:MAG: 1-acyl-sn-glycerol-3-phosphate acyltransferase [Acetobacteraceae bacterium]|nr:1-acyl-sn-glycerol-3-phosphate acyltransferase [Acetobacteraceae bacterium]
MPMVTTARRLPPIGLVGLRPDALPLGGGGVAQRARAVWRGASVVLWTLPAFLIQAVLLMLPGRGKVVLARLYWAVVCRLMGLQVRVIGTPARQPGRPVVFASNHSSWLDILALGGTLEACFIAKEEVGRWPVIRTIAWLGRTVFVSRKAAETGRERDSMRARLEAGDNLVLFPEGTSSDGSRVLPFRSAFFSVVEERGAGAARPLIQPVSIVYDRLNGLPMGRCCRPVSAWYGDMDLGSHFWRLARYRRLRAAILLHPPLDPAAYPSRKALAQAVWEMVADGAAALRQNRPVEPRSAPGAFA